MKRTLVLYRGCLFLAIGLMMACCVSAQNVVEKKLTVDELFRLASENSKQLKLSYSSVSTAKSMTDVQNNRRLPTLGASLLLAYLGNGTILNRNFSGAMEAANPHFMNNFALEAAEVIFAGGAISNNIAKAKLQEQIATLDFEKERQDIRFLLVGAYLDLYKLMNQKEVYLKYIDQTHLVINQIKARKQVGMSLENDITRYELLLKQSELALTTIKNNSTILNNQLITILGLSDSVKIVPDAGVLSTALNNKTLPELINQASTSLPELKVADIRLKMAEKDLRLSKAAYFPSLSLIGANYLSGPILIEIPTINKNYNYWYFGLGINYSLSSLYTNKRTVNVAKRQQTTAELERQVIKEQSDLAIKNAYIKYNETFENLNTLEKSLVLAMQNYELVNNRYLNNLVLITEMLDASNEKLNADLQVVNARIDILFNYYKLKRLIGTL